MGLHDMCLTQQHVADPDPVLGFGRGQQRLELVPSDQGRWPLVHPLGQHLEQADRDIPGSSARGGGPRVRRRPGSCIQSKDGPVREAHHLEEEPPRVLDALVVRAPVVQPEPAKVLELIQPARGTGGRKAGHLRLSQNPPKGETAGRKRYNRPLECACAHGRCTR